MPLNAYVSVHTIYPPRTFHICGLPRSRDRYARGIVFVNTASLRELAYRLSLRRISAKRYPDVMYHHKMKQTLDRKKQEQASVSR